MPVFIYFILDFLNEFFRLILEMQKKKSMEVKAVSACSVGKQDVRRDSESQERAFGINHQLSMGLIQKTQLHKDNVQKQDLLEASLKC